jgi:hypothetical protein
MHLKFSQDVESLLDRLSKQPLTLDTILSETSERGFSLSIGLLVLPFLFPMPPGLSTPLGSACLFLSLQMTFGRHTPWLPKKVRKFVFPRTFSLYLLRNIKKVTGFLEKIVRPRFLSLAENPYIWRLNGALIAWMAVLLMLPIPLTNSIPAIGILILAVATLESDGLLMYFGYGLALFNTVFFSFLGYALWLAPNLLPNIFK